MIGRLERVSLRDVWAHEAYDLTTWLVDNPDVLKDVIGLELSNLKREQAAGSFSVDIVAEDADGRIVVIENQLERSNHDHLGKVITYTAMFSAKAAIWIVSDPRPEHIAAIGWLNEGGLCEFFLLKLEAVRIGPSEPAPLLTLITGPSAEQVQVGETKKDQEAERFSEREGFWTTLLTRSNKRTRTFSSLKPSQTSYVSARSGSRGVSFVYALKQRTAAVEIYIDTGDQTETKAIFKALEAQRSEIERVFEAPLSWQELPTKRASRIKYEIATGGYRTPETQDQLQEEMVDRMTRLEAAIRPRLTTAS